MYDRLSNKYGLSPCKVGKFGLTPKVINNNTFGASPATFEDIDNFDMQMLQKALISKNPDK